MHDLNRCRLMVQIIHSTGLIFYQTWNDRHVPCPRLGLAAAAPIAGMLGADPKR